MFGFSKLLKFKKTSGLCKAFSTSAETVFCKRIGVIGAPFNLGQPKSGVENGPKVLRESGILEELRSRGYDTIDKGDIQPPPNIDDTAGPDGEIHHSAILQYNKKLAENVQDIRRDGRFCLSLGGDHSTAIGTVTGHSQADPGQQVSLLWVDAHADINTGATSPTGNMHGMPVSFLLKELCEKVNKIPNTAWPSPSIDARNVVFIGLRDVDPGESNFLLQLGIKHFYMKDIDAIGIKETIAQALDHLNPSSKHSLHVAFDIDSLDPAEAPSTGTPVRGGLTLREGLQIVHSARNTGRLGALDLVEVNPKLGDEQDASTTIAAAKAIILAAVTG